MNKKFSAFPDASKLIFLEGLTEEDFGIYFTFDKEIRGFLAENYAEFTETNWVFREQSEGLQLCAYLTGTNEKTATFSCKALSHYGGDSDRYDDAELLPWKVEKYPEGFQFEIPIQFLVGITIARTPLRK